MPSLKGELYVSKECYDCFGIMALLKHLNCSDVNITTIEFDLRKQLDASELHMHFEGVNKYDSLPRFKTEEGWSFWESSAIIRHIVRMTPGAGSYLGNDEEEKSKVDLALFWRNDHLIENGDCLMKYVFNNEYSSDENLDQYRDGLENALEILTESGHFIKGDSFVCGTDNMTVADFQIWAYLVIIQVTKQIK